MQYAFGTRNVGTQRCDAEAHPEALSCKQKGSVAENHTCLLEEQIDDGRSLAGMSGHRFLCYKLGQERSRLRKIQG
jgi:hypothetical protein